MSKSIEKIRYPKSEQLTSIKTRKNRVEIKPKSSKKELKNYTETEYDPFQIKSKLAYQDKPIINILKQYVEESNNKDWIKKINNWSNCGNNTKVSIEGKTSNMYCGLRTCSICNRIRYHNQIKKYGDKLKVMILNKNIPMYLSTTGTKSVIKKQLRNELIKQHKQTSNTVESYNLQKRRLQQPETFNGLSAQEITYNEKTGKYHPHNHTAHCALTNNEGNNDLETYKPKPKEKELRWPRKTKSHYKDETLYTIENGEIIKHKYRTTYGNKKNGIIACNLYYTNKIINDHLKNNPNTANIKGTNITRFYDARELIKYPIKTITGKGRHNKKVNPKAILNILESIQNLPLIKVYGTLNERIKKPITNQDKHEPTQEQTEIIEISDKIKVKSQLTNLEPGTYQRIVTKHTVTVYQTCKYIPIVNEETGEPETEIKITKDKKGETKITETIKYIKSPCNKLVHEYIPNKKQFNKWNLIEYTNQINQSKHVKKQNQKKNI